MTAPGRVIGYEDALTVARQCFLADGCLHMSTLARELRVSRATLYRVVGSRDRLLGDVLWQLAARTLAMVIESVDALGLRGIERLLAISNRFHAEVAGFEPVQRFLRDEPGDAFRILFTSTGSVHERMVATWESIFRAALEAGEFGDLRFDVREAAYVYVRVGESEVYGQTLAGIVPRAGLCDEVRRSILQGAR